MAVHIGTRYQNQLLSPMDQSATMDFFWDFERALFPHFPGLQASKHLGENHYQWFFRPLSYGGYDITIEFRTRFERLSDSIQVHSVPGVGFTTLDGGWSFESRGDKTHVNFDFDIKGSLQLPFFLKGIVAPAAEKELTKLFNQYLNNVDQALKA